MGATAGEERDQHLSSLLSLSSDVYWEQDAQFRFTRFTGVRTEYVGALQRSSIGKRRWDFSYFNMSGADWDAHRALLAARRPFHDLELGRIDEAGRVAWVSVSGEAVFDAAGGFIGYRGLGKDITPRKRAEALTALEHSVTSALAGAQTRSAGVQAVLRAICEVERWQSGRYFVVDDAAQVLRFAEGWAAENRLAREFIEKSKTIVYRPGQGLSGLVWNTGEALWVRDVSKDPRAGGSAGLAGEALRRASLVIPVKVEGSVAGVLSFSSSDIREPDPQLLRSLQAIGGQVGQFLQRKLAEAALNDSEQRFRQTFELAASGIAHVSLDGRFLRVNRRLCAILGYTEQELLGRSVKEISHPADRDVTDAERTRLRKGEVQTTNFEKRYVRSDGTTVWVNLTVALARTPQDEPLYEISVMEEITERRMAEKALRESEARFRSLTNLSSDWYWEQDAQLRFTKFEGRGAAPGNYEPARAVLGRQLWDKELGLDPSSTDWAAHRAALERHEPFRDVEYSYKDKHGRRFYVSASGEPIFDDEGRFQGYRGTARDITQRRRDEEALRRFRAAIDMSVDAIFLTDRATMRFIDMNRAACHALGRSRAELLAMGPDRVFALAKAEIERAFDEVIDKGAAGVRTERSYPAGDGSERWTELHRRALRADEGWIIVTVARDITDRKLAEQRRAKQLRRQERIARFGQDALGELDPGELIAGAAQTVLEGLSAETVAYLELAGEPGEFVLRTLLGARSESSPRVLRFADEHPLRRVLASGRHVLTTGPVLGIAWARELGSVAALPIRGHSGVRGIVCIGQREADGFGVQALNFAESITTILSTALQRIDSEARLTYLAQFDSLTGLPNRALLTDRFTQAIAQAKRYGRSLGVLFVDLDEFKMVNDTLGHSGGDELLKSTAGRLQSALRPGDTVARIAGDEFALLLADLADADHAGLVAQRIVAALSEPFQVREREVVVTASIGIATFPGDGQDAEALLAAADAAMYRAKQSGRNAYQFFTPDLNERMRERAVMSAELRSALERAEFELHYQPKVELRSRTVCGVEALLRWRHPARGLTAPSQFIPLLEESGLIVAVGEWALAHACEALKSRMAAGLPPHVVAVNLSVRQFKQPDLATRLLGIVERAGVAPQLVELEITESQLVQDPEHAVRTLYALREHGIGLALDDFGTGYSSLSYLTRFPLSALKIDRSFIANALDDEAAAAVVRTIIDMAHTLGFTVVAEGVETEAQAAFLRGLRCDEGQGYLFARPMPESELRDFLRAPQAMAGVRAPRRARRARLRTLGKSP